MINAVERGALSFTGSPMPPRMKHPCNRIGCKNLTTSRYCDDCGKKVRHQYEQGRGSARSRGYTKQWERARKTFLKENPMCCVEGCNEIATVVDHIIPHKGDMELFWGRANWQPMCKPDHDSKTAREDGRWG